MTFRNVDRVIWDKTHFQWLYSAEHKYHSCNLSWILLVCDTAYYKGQNMIDKYILIGMKPLRGTTKFSLYFIVSSMQFEATTGIIRTFDGNCTWPSHYISNCISYISTHGSNKWCVTNQTDVPNVYVSELIHKVLVTHTGIEKLTYHLFR